MSDEPAGKPDEKSAEEPAKDQVEKPAKKTTPAQRKRQKAANAAADEQSEDLDKVTTKDDDLPDEREEWFRAPGLRRMSLDFSSSDRAQVDRMQASIETFVIKEFSDAWELMVEIWDVVRDPEINEQTGEILTDAYGYTVWKKDPRNNRHYEDWSRLTYAQQKNFLFEITTKIFDWEQRKERLWFDAMMSKGIFTERFAIEYDRPMSGTIEDRTAHGNEKAAEDRYLAIMKASVSRRADAVVRSMNNLMLRLKDVMVD